MTTKTIKVAPITKKDRDVHVDVMCFCRSVWPIIIFIRFLGILPMTTKHENNKCVFVRSRPWTIYSAIACSLYSYQIFVNVDVRSIMSTKSLIVLLNHITNTVYAYYIVLMVLIVSFKIPKYTDTLNKFQLVFKHGVFCQSARKIAWLSQHGVILIFGLLTFCQATIYYWLHNSKNYETNFSISDFLFRFSQTISLCFYASFFSINAVVIGGFACFEKLLISSLEYVPVHPMASVDDTNNERNFLGLVHYQLCKGIHQTPTEFSRLVPSEIVDYLRVYHEEICLCIYAWNDAVDPLFLIHTVLELGILIIHWYAVVAHLVYTFQSPVAPTIHILNCIFVSVHTYGLYLFLKNAQIMKNMVQGLTNFLLEYSTRVSNMDGHQQVRIFIEKLKNHRPFTASAVFTIDLGIAGPISANILTYVLVALQFEIPEE